MVWKDNAEWVESLRSAPHQEIRLTEAMQLEALVKQGDLLHIDGQVVRALDALATRHRAEYLGIFISRLSDGIFEIRDGGDIAIAIADSALEAINMCEARRSKFRATPLREPEPPTYDEALATKCDAEAREWEARKGVMGRGK